MSAAGDVAAARSGNRLLPVLLVGAAVSVALGVYGKVHTPTFEPISTFGFPSMIEMKVWFATAAAVGAVVQLLLALWMYGRLGSARAPHWVGPLHRVTGAATFVLTVPVAVHCLWSLGFQSYDTRVLVHSLLGCLFYGAYVSKVLSLHVPGVPGKVLPWLGGTLFTVLVALFLSASVWYWTSGS